MRAFSWSLMLSAAVTMTSVSPAHGRPSQADGLVIGRAPDDVATLFYAAVHPHIRPGAHQYAKSTAHPILNDLLERTVRQILKRKPAGKFFFRYYIYQCALDDEACDQPGDFDEDRRVRHDIFYDFDR